MLWLGAVLLGYALYRVYDLHGHLHELHQSINNRPAASTSAATSNTGASNVQVRSREEVLPAWSCVYVCVRVCCMKAARTGSLT